MKIIWLLFTTLVVVNSIAPLNDSQFVTFLAKYNKQYSQDEVHRRYEIFQLNLKAIEEHNSKDSSYKLGITEFTDMTNEEFRAAKLSFSITNFKSLNVDLAKESNLQAPPTALDWRTSTNPRVVGPVRDDRTCAADGVISIIDAISSEFSVKTGHDFYSFSPAYVTDCYGYGCGGSDPKLIWAFITKVGLNWTYDGCPKGPGIGLCIDGYDCTKSGDEDALKDAVASVGPLSITIDASHLSIQLYTSGIYYEPTCNSTLLDHSMVLVGYGTAANGQDYWIARNSWGTRWGQQGDIFLARNRDNHCGVASAACGATNVHTCA